MFNAGIAGSSCNSAGWLFFLRKIEKIILSSISILLFLFSFFFFLLVSDLLETEPANITLLDQIACQNDIASETLLWSFNACCNVFLEVLISFVIFLNIMCNILNKRNNRLHRVVSRTMSMKLWSFLLRDQGMWRIVGSQIVLPLIWKKLHLPLTIVMIPSLDVLQESKFLFFFLLFFFFLFFSKCILCEQRNIFLN